MQLYCENGFRTSTVLPRHSKIHKLFYRTFLNGQEKQHIHKNIHTKNSKTQHAAHHCINSSFSGLKASETVQQQNRLCDISSGWGLEEANAILVASSTHKPLKLLLFPYVIALPHYCSCLLQCAFYCEIHFTCSQPPLLTPLWVTYII